MFISFYCFFDLLSLLYRPQKCYSFDFIFLSNLFSISFYTHSAPCTLILGGKLAETLHAWYDPIQCLHRNRKTLVLVFKLSKFIAPDIFENRYVDNTVIACLLTRMIFHTLENFSCFQLKCLSLRSTNNKHTTCWNPYVVDLFFNKAIVIQVLTLPTAANVIWKY